MKKAVFVDLDGTLLTTDKRLSPRNRRALERAHSLGFEIIPATGRLWEGIPEEIRALPFVRFAVTVNGAEVYDAEARRPLVRRELPADRAVEILRILRGYDGVFNCYAGGWGYMERQMFEAAPDYVLEPAFLAIIRKLCIPVGNLEAYIRCQFAAVQKLQIFFNDLELNGAAYRQLRSLLPDTSVSSSIRGNLEITHALANKGEGARFLCGHLGIDRENVIAFGDGSNDASLLRWAGTSVAMKNAAPEARQAAGKTTLSNDEDGVAEYLEKFF